VAAISDLASLTTAEVYALQYATERSIWTSDTTDLISLRQHWRTALENLESIQALLAQPELFPDP